ncbi:hypothetical protein [Leptospira interrogans]|uniref:hypothetical protein n=1 Tax=Leptospira interrogans TaxID=173 RepID=UPI0009E49FBC|nr:hypothetical protein [Leptospira interrogans]MBE0304175.1 hypothetical protein [Leptospira interrogans serovar Yeoncheon]MBM2889722.1 hypothetical protein [Leptospira interrogans]
MKRRARPGIKKREECTSWILAMGANVAPGVPSIQDPRVGMTGGDSGDPKDGNQNPVPEHCGTTGAGE